MAPWKKTLVCVALGSVCALVCAGIGAARAGTGDRTTDRVTDDEQGAFGNLRKVLRAGKSKARRVFGARHRASEPVVATRVTPPATELWAPVSRPSSGPAAQALGTSPRLSRTMTENTRDAKKSAPPATAVVRPSDSRVKPTSRRPAVSKTTRPRNASHASNPNVGASSTDTSRTQRAVAKRRAAPAPKTPAAHAKTGTRSRTKQSIARKPIARPTLRPSYAKTSTPATRKSSRLKPVGPVRKSASVRKSTAKRTTVPAKRTTASTGKSLPSNSTRPRSVRPSGSKLVSRAPKRKLASKARKPANALGLPKSVNRASKSPVNRAPKRFAARPKTLKSTRSLAASKTVTKPKRSKPGDANPKAPRVSRPASSGSVATGSSVAAVESTVSIREGAGLVDKAVVKSTPSTKSPSRLASLLGAGQPGEVRRRFRVVAGGADAKKDYASTYQRFEQRIDPNRQSATAQAAQRRVYLPTDSISLRSQPPKPKPASTSRRVLSTRRSLPKQVFAASDVSEKKQATAPKRAIKIPARSAAAAAAPERTASNSAKRVTVAAKRPSTPKPSAAATIRPPSGQPEKANRWAFFPRLRGRRTEDVPPTPSAHAATDAVTKDSIVRTREAKGSQRRPHHSVAGSAKSRESTSSIVRASATASTVTPAILGAGAIDSNPQVPAATITASRVSVQAPVSPPARAAIAPVLPKPRNFRTYVPVHRPTRRPAGAAPVSVPLVRRKALESRPSTAGSPRRDRSSVTSGAIPAVSERARTAAIK